MENKYGEPYRYDSQFVADCRKLQSIYRVGKNQKIRPYKGKYYNELSQIDRSEFLSAKLEYANIPNLDENTLRSLFLMFNRKGRTMSNEQFKKIETQLVESK